jgi:DNA-binding response OmpR family regulator
MDIAVEKRHNQAAYLQTVSTEAAEHADTVIRETREQFVAAFDALCDGIALAADPGLFSPSGMDDAVKGLHRMAGLAGTIGFPRVSAEAASLEDSLEAGLFSPTELCDRIAALRGAFAQDAAGAAAPPASPQPMGESLTVLLIEDEPVQRLLLSTQLRTAGHSVVQVVCGEEALAAARQTRPDVILLDVELPGIDGYTVCRLLKSDPALAAIPIAFLSAHAKLDHRLTGLSFGADDFLTKPIDPRELELRIQLLSKRGQSVAAPAAPASLTYEMFCDRARQQMGLDRSALAVIRTPPDRASEVVGLTRDEIRRRDLCGQLDRSHVVVLLPDTGAADARGRIGSIVEKCRANGMGAVHAGIAASPAAHARTLDALLEEADEALAIARYENVPTALCPDGPRPERGAEPIAPMVLVADDDPDVVRIVDAHLAAGGYRRVLTFDGSRALEEIRAQRPDVLVLDLMMPRLTGFDVLAGLRDMGEERPRVIVLSARGREDDVIRAFSLGADDFMVKPFNPQELLARVARLLK